MSRLLQPSVVFIEGGEKPFYKKVPKTEKQDNPKLLKKQLPKMVKSVTHEDRVLFLATADNPWMGQPKSIVSVFKSLEHYLDVVEFKTILGADLFMLTLNWLIDNNVIKNMSIFAKTN